MTRRSGERLTAEQRRRIVRAFERGYEPDEIAARFDVTLPTVRLWVRRFEEEGEPGLQSRQWPVPERPPHLTPRPVVEEIVRMVEEEPGLSLAELTRRVSAVRYEDGRRMAPETVSKWLDAAGWRREVRWVKQER